MGATMSVIFLLANRIKPDSINIRRHVCLAVFCSGGGEISYGYEVTGGIPDSWKGYRQKATVPAGSYSISLNKLYRDAGSEPHMAYSNTIWPGHGVATIRAVVYAPNLIYSLYQRRASVRSVCK